MEKKLSILFHRDFKSFTGGHLKVWDYYQHVNSSNNYEADIYFTPDSSWHNNPWSKIKHKCLNKWDPFTYDILFLAGLDWLALTKQQQLSPPAPVINLIQSVRHADKKNPLYDFLKFPATRLCVSKEVADAINNTGIVNGPVIVNPNSLDHSLLPEIIPTELKDIPLLIIGLKNPELAMKISKQLQDDNIDHHLITDHMLRNEFLSLINRANITLFLPIKNEGFYLPALEGMYLKTMVICPDCIGNRSFCIDRVTCLRPDHNYSDIIKAVKTGLLLTNNKRKTLIDEAYIYAQNSTLEREKKIFFKALFNLKNR